MVGVTTTSLARLASCLLGLAELRSRRGAFLLNMRSIRSVIMKPPTTLIVRAADGDEPEDLADVVARPGGEQRRDERDPADGVRAAHERRVEERRNAGDDLVADEGRQDEDVQIEDPVAAHHVAPAPGAGACGARSSFTLGWTISPP